MNPQDDPPGADLYCSDLINIIDISTDQSAFSIIDVTGAATNQSTLSGDLIGLTDCYQPSLIGCEGELVVGAHCIDESGNYSTNVMDLE